VVNVGKQKGKWKPEFGPQVNSLYLFARKRLAELTPKESGPGRGKKESDQNDPFFSERKGPALGKRRDGRARRLARPRLVDGDTRD
jgi:hypothetical protein